jgi:4-carboxymuconolactone decarboxylase
MRGIVRLAIVLTWSVLVAVATIPHIVSAQGDVRANAEAPLPTDVDPDSRNRLPPVKRDDLDERGKKRYDAVGLPLRGAAAIRLHGSGVNVRWASAVGRQLTELAILTTAREHDQPYEWSLHEMEAVAVGLDPAVINVVRHRNPLEGVGRKEAIIIQAGREIFGRHQLSPDLYARALSLFGKTNLVDILDLMAGYSGTATRLTAFNQQMPPNWKQLLPLPFTPPGDIHQDSRSRLPLLRSEGQTQQAVPSLYSRQLAPEGTGPGHITRHGAGVQTLDARVGARVMALAVLVTAREHDAQYEWTINEPAALKAGLESALVDVVRLRKPPTGLAEKDAILVEFGRELFRRHNVSPETYARALKAFGERDLVDLVGLMAQHSSDAALLIAFDQHLPVGAQPRLRD